MRNQRLLTASYLNLLPNTKNSDLVESYAELMNSINQSKFRYMISFTFTESVTDIISVYEVCRKIKRFLNRHFYRRCDHASEIKFLFVVEPHYLDSRIGKRFHIHFLMTDVINCKRAYSHLPEQLRCLRLETALIKLYRIKSDQLNSDARLSRLKISKIYDQENLADYLLKQLKHTSDDIYQMIDFENSDLSFDLSLKQKVQHCTSPGIVRPLVEIGTKW